MNDLVTFARWLRDDPEYQHIEICGTVFRVQVSDTLEPGHIIITQGCKGQRRLCDGGGLGAGWF